ncbi:hypothetical protein BJY52DRAFT_1184732 [Lactarius psammicola]|nr:hypothetical protein BJY52DRAFT_1184732 [Lactarius psammicola]
MTSHGTSPTPPPAAASQPNESSVQNVSIIGQSSQNVSVVRQSGPSYQPNIYHPHVYTPYYNQTVPYAYTMQPSTQPSAPAGATTPSFVPVATRQSEPPIPIPVTIPSEERKSPPPVRRGPGRPRKQHTGETATPNPTDSAAKRPRAPAQKGHTSGSQNWSAQDLIALARYVEGAVPLGMNVWKHIEGLYNNEYAIPNNRQERGWDNMRDKWYKIVSDGPPTGEGEMPDALNEVFRVNNMLEDIGGLVDPEDPPEGGGGAGRHNDSDSDGIDDAPPSKKTYMTSRPGTDGGSIGIGSGSGSTTKRTKHGSASLAEKLLSSISPDAKARQNDNRAVMRLYLQQIRAQEETIHVRELQNDALRQEVANLQEKLQTTIREVNRAERRADKLEMHLDVLEMMGKWSGHSSQRRRTHRKRSLSSSSCSSSPRSQSPSRIVPKKKLDKGKTKAARQDKGDEGLATSLEMSQGNTGGNARATTPDEWLASSYE